MASCNKNQTEPKVSLAGFIFHKETFGLIGALVLLWFSIGLLADANLQNKDLKPNSGKVGSIRVVKKVFPRRSRELRVTLNNKPVYFTSNNKEDFNKLLSGLKPGGSVTIFTRPKLLGVFGMKNKYEIFHMTEGSAILIDLDEYKKSISGMWFFCLVGSITFFILYYIRTKKRYKEV